MNQRRNRGPPRGGGGFQEPPVREGEEIDVIIEAVGEKGDGIAKVKGFVIFVPGVKEGENCKVRITKVLKRVGFGEKIGEGSAPAQGESASEMPAEEELPMDSEDFGEESEEPSEEFSDEE